MSYVPLCPFQLLLQHSTVPKLSAKTAIFILLTASCSSGICTSRSRDNFSWLHNIWVPWSEIQSLGVGDLMAGSWNHWSVFTPIFRSWSWLSAGTSAGLLVGTPTWDLSTWQLYWASLQHATGLQEQVLRARWNHLAWAAAFLRLYCTLLVELVT